MPSLWRRLFKHKRKPFSYWFVVLGWRPGPSWQLAAILKCNTANQRVFFFFFLASRFSSHKIIFSGNQNRQDNYVSSKTRPCGHAGRLYGLSHVHVEHLCTHYQRNIIPRALNSAQEQLPEITNKTGANMLGGLEGENQPGGSWGSWVLLLVCSKSSTCAE